MKKPTYINLIKELKEEILTSRYTHAKLVNKEILILYFKVGKLLVQKTEMVGYGAKVIENISNDLQKRLPGLGGFSVTNLKCIKKFYENYSSLEISQSVTDQSFIENTLVAKPPSAKKSINSHVDFLPDFFSISLTRHYEIISSVSSWYKQFFAETKKHVGIVTYKITGNLLQKLKKYFPSTEDLINIVKGPFEGYLTAKQ